MGKKVIIVGKGIAGTLLAFELLNNGCEVIIYNDPQLRASSLDAGGVLHPYKRKEYSVKKEYYDFLKTAVEKYKEIEQLTGHEFLKEAKMYVWGKRIDEVPFSKHLSCLSKEEFINLSRFFNTEAPIIAVKGVYTINTKIFFTATGHFLERRTFIKNEKLDSSKLEFKGGNVIYKDDFADIIIFTEGVSAVNNKFFKHLPFIYNRAEFLKIITGEPLPDFVYDNGFKLVNSASCEYWYGATYTWLSNSTPGFEQLKEHLQSWLKIPYVITEQNSVQRPTTVGQLPFIGIHPNNKMLGIFNGLGARGFTYSPKFAKEFADLIVGNLQIMPSVNTLKFNGLFT